MQPDFQQPHQLTEKNVVKFFSTICQDELRRAFLRKGPIAIVRSAARRGADRTARARCVQQTNINSLNFCLPQLAQFLPGPLSSCLCASRS